MQKNQLAVTLEPADRLWVREQAALQGRSESNFVAFCVKLARRKLAFVSDDLRDLITRSDRAAAVAEQVRARAEEVQRKFESFIVEEQKKCGS